MFKLSIATTYTNPEERMDPWKEALTCYNDLADEVVRTGENWPYEFSWDYIGKTFNESYELATGDWVIRMDLDYFFHENDFQGIRKVLSENFDKPAGGGRHGPLDPVVRTDPDFARCRSPGQRCAFGGNA